MSIRMRRGVAMLALLLAGVGAGPASAGGSMSLEDAITEIFATSPTLVAEVRAAVARDDRPPAEIVCIAETRLGNRWVMLGGVRILPVDCEIAGRTLRVEGTVTFRDGKGRVLRRIDEETFRKAETVEQTDLRWVWK